MGKSILHVQFAPTNPYKTMHESYQNPFLSVLALLLSCRHDRCKKKSAYGRHKLQQEIRVGPVVLVGRTDGRDIVALKR